MNRLIIIIFGALALLGAVSAIYYSWQKSIERQALLEYNQKQLEQSLKDQEEFRKKVRELETKQKDIIEKNIADKKALEDQLEAVYEFINSNDDKTADQPSSPILKETIRKLSGTSK